MSNLYSIESISNSSFVGNESFTFNGDDTGLTMLKLWGCEKYQLGACKENYSSNKV